MDVIEILRMQLKKEKKRKKDLRNEHNIFVCSFFEIVIDEFDDGWWICSDYEMRIMDNGDG